MRAFLVAAVVAVACARALPFSPYPLWATDVGSPVSRVVLAGDYVLVAPRGNGHARFGAKMLSRATGDVVWTALANYTAAHRDPKGSVGYAGPAGGPSSSAPGVVAFGFAGDFEVHGVDGMSGAPMWRYNLVAAGHTRGCAKIDWVSGGTGRIFVATECAVLALNTTGGLLWEHRLQYSDGDMNMREIQIWQNRVGILVAQGMAVGIDVRTGGALWSSRGNVQDWTINLYGQAVLSPDGAVAVEGLATNSQLTSNNGTLAVLNANNGATLVQAIFEGNSVGTVPGVGAGVGCFNSYLQVVAPYTYVTCYNYTSGKQTFTAPYMWYVSSVTVGANVYVTAVPTESQYSANLYAYAPADGTALWNVPSPFSREAAVYQNGVLYGGGGEYSASKTSVTALQVEPQQ